MAAVNVKISYLPYEGVKVEDKRGLSASFKFGHSIQEGLVFPHEFEDERDEFDEDGWPVFSNPLYVFFDEKFMVATEKSDKTTICIMKDSVSFIFEGYELIGMDFEEFMRLNLLRFDYVEEKAYGLPTGDGPNFRYYDIYYNMEHQIEIYVWRKRIRLIRLRDYFFRAKKYEDPQYLKMFHFRKIED